MAKIIMQRIGHPTGYGTAEWCGQCPYCSYFAVGKYQTTVIVSVELHIKEEHPAVVPETK